jgi:hypothetical protein
MNASPSRADTRGARVSGLSVFVRVGDGSHDLYLA